MSDLLKCVSCRGPPRSTCRGRLPSTLATTGVPGKTQLSPVPPLQRGTLIGSPGSHPAMTTCLGGGAVSESPVGRTRSARRVLRYGWSPADPARRPALFVNPRSGDGAATRAGVARRARDRGIRVVVLEPGQNLAAEVDDAVAAGADALGMAGGDGSLAVVASAAAEHGLPFICVPAGTRNHFALDLGVDRHDLNGALDAFGAGVERRIDMGEVNGRTFLNNVSLGIYGEAVRQSTYRDAKVRTLVEVAQTVLSPMGDAASLRLTDDVGREHAQLAVVLVSNNPYALDPPVAGTRPALDGGLLGILILDAPDRRPGRGRAWAAPEFEIFSGATVAAGIDGEAVPLSSPLRFAMRRRVLRVRIAAHHPGASPSARLRMAAPGRGLPTVREGAQDGRP
ncbi:diacylglycerol/lipid kinase family protein [Georgenia ruanii]|nr:diacylglycerol kinase family protein [Georgenia ruanii]